jgi:hypothetical protein
LYFNVSSAEACYVNTGHPDFIGGSRAMSVINDRVNASKNTVPAITESQKNARAQASAPLTNAQALVNSNSTINSGIIEGGDSAGGFFGSFFSKKKKPGVLEAPPTVLKASGTLNEREYMETEVISKCGGVLIRARVVAVELL